MESKYKCSDCPKRIRRRLHSNGSVHYVKQCPICGHTSSPMKKRDTELLLLDQYIEPYDELIRKAFFDSIDFKEFRLKNNIK